MYCIYCGQPINEDSVYCPFCGKSQKMKESIFCPKCGSKNIDYLNHTIQITNEGIIPGSGLKSINSEISYKTLKIPVLVIGVTTAIEIKNNHISYILSSKDIDDYVSQISKIIGETINDTLYHL